MPNVYFVSDFHLGTGTSIQTSEEREKIIVKWLKSISQEVGILHLVGDIFDYWFEYTEVIPAGYHRLLSCLADMNDMGWEIHFHIGNHDMWVGNHFTQAFGATIHRQPFLTRYGDKSFFITHGDGLGKTGWKYQFIKKMFSSSFNQWLFARIHPNTALKIMRKLSFWSRTAHPDHSEMKDLSKEVIYQFALSHSKSHQLDFYIFGHRHSPAIIDLHDNSSKYVNLGDWLKFCSYVKFDGQTIELLYYKG